MADRLIVRSYRRVFRIDRRIYRVDRWALPVPGGVPLRGVAYFAVALVGVIALGGVPVIAVALDELSAPLRYVILPLTVAVLATQAAPDGRVAHRFAADWLRLRLRSRRRSAGRRVPLEGERVPSGGRLAISSDAGRRDFAPAVVRGPACVEFGVQLALTRGRRGRRVGRPTATAGLRSVTLEEGDVLEVRR